MTDDLSGKAMTMIKRDGAHQCSMPHERADCLFKAINLTIPSDFPVKTFPEIFEEYVKKHSPETDTHIAIPVSADRLSVGLE
jgi:hypothetical protein